MGYFDKFNTNKGISFMDGANKANLAIAEGKKVHISDFAFLKGDDGDFACLALEEFPNTFFFGNAIITAMLKDVDEDGMREELKAQPIVFTRHTSKKGREYMGFEFVATDAQ